MLRLAKYHGLGNDFLVHMLDTPPTPGRDLPLGALEVAALCERHTGVGADGLLTVWPLRSGVVRMTLRNADGSAAETSGNGIRCAALAALDGGLVPGPELVLETDAGSARARLLARDGTGGASLSVSMGQVALGKAFADVLGRHARAVDVGNPHLVLYPVPGNSVGLPLRAVELSTLEHGVDGELDEGCNVESVVARARGTADRSDIVDLVVWERGAGATQACGSGSVAAAAALRAAGLVGDRVEVRNPGGTLLVELGGPADAPTAELTGPAQLVAGIEIELAAVLAATRSHAADSGGVLGDSDLSDAATEGISAAL